MVDGMKSGLNWNNCCAGCVSPSNVISFYIVIVEPPAALSVPHLLLLLLLLSLTWLAGWSISNGHFTYASNEYMRVHGKTD